MRDRYVLFSSYVLVALLTLASAASAQVCVAHTTCGSDSHPCWSAQGAVGLPPGIPCAAPFHGNATPVPSCISSGNALCCGCTQAPVACAAMLMDSNTVQIIAQSDLGLTSITPTSVVNADLAIYGFSPGTTSPVELIASKIDTSQWAVVDLHVCDTSTCITCDPLVTLVAKETGRPVSQSFAGLPQEEGKVTIYNGSRGLRNLSLTVNGVDFEVRGLKDGEQRTVDAASAMLMGTANTITVTGMGPRGGAATLMIHD